MDRRAFIRDNTRLLRPPLAPRLRLHLADEAVALWQKTEEELGRIGLPPPFWAFAWAGGQALAGFLAERPETVAGKFVLDFASGSGLVAIAAARAGAARVEASEIDDFALTAIEMNARENGVTIEARTGDLVGVDDGWDVVLAGDISYQRDMAEAATAWLEGLARRGADVLIGDPGRAYLARDRLECVAEYRVPVTRALEDADIKRSGVYRFRAYDIVKWSVPQPRLSACAPCAARRAPVRDPRRARERRWRNNGGPPRISPSFSKFRVFFSKLFQTKLWRFCGISRGCKPPKPKVLISKFFAAPASLQPYSRRHPAAFRRLAPKGPERGRPLARAAVQWGRARSWRV